MGAAVGKLEMEIQSGLAQDHAIESLMIFEASNFVKTKAFAVQGNGSRLLTGRAMRNWGCSIL